MGARGQDNGAGGVGIVQLDLDYARYPNHAGYKEHSTSRDAAIAIEGTGRAATLRTMVLDALMDKGCMTPDETAGFLSEDILSIRPRFSELSSKNLIKQTGETRKNKSGKSAKVWVAV